MTPAERSVVDSVAVETATLILPRLEECAKLTSSARREAVRSMLRTMVRNAILTAVSQLRTPPVIDTPDDSDADGYE